MRQNHRHAEILILLEAHGSCQISDLAQRFDVSDETIRRDIRQLETAGRVFKIHGGVRLPEGAFETPYMKRLSEHVDEKRMIAARAVQMVEPGMTLLIDSGTTSYWLAKALAPVRNLTVITNAIEVAREMTGRNGCRVFFAGGELDPDYHSCFGREAEAFMSRFTPEIAFFAISCIDSRRGLVDFHYPEATLKSVVAPFASKVVILADSSKFERQGLVKALGFDQIHTLVTDAKPGADLGAALGEVEIQIAGPILPAQDEF